MSKAEIAMPGIIIDKRKVDGTAMALSGYVEAMGDVLGLLQDVFVHSKDIAVKQTLDVIIEELEAWTEQNATLLNDHAYRIGALKSADEAKR